MLVSLLSLGALVSSALASPTSKYAIHEKRDVLPRGWSKRDAIDRSVVLPMRIALSQSNMDRGDELLNEVSHPKSEKYGQHWSADEVAKIFSPSGETIDMVKEWLVASGISDNRLKPSKGLHWINFNATVDEAESLLKTKYNVYEHSSGQPHIACEEYSLPVHLRDHIDFVLPSIQFDVKTKMEGDLAKREVQKLGRPGGSGSPKLGNWLAKDGVKAALADCDKQITPNCLRALYDFPKGTTNSSDNSYGIVEYSPQTYLPKDLDMFFSNFSEAKVGARPTFNSVDGANIESEYYEFDYNGESDLDLQYAMSLVYPQQVTLFEVGDYYEGGSFNNFLDAVDSSYCGGDDPAVDGIYPDPYTNISDVYEGYTCGNYSIPKVISTSYSYDEAALTSAYQIRQCNEYLKLGLMGTTFLYSSGDYGVGGGQGECLNANGTFNDGSDGKFNPTFPGTCPYVLSVGATQVKNNTDIVSALASGTQPEMAAETVIYSGGGFSNVFSIPSYQDAAVQKWFTDYPPPYGADRFNNSRQTRGYPDVSANGANYVVAVDFEFALVYGTSASSPTFGSILTLINEARLSAGKSSIGFINPTLYEHPEVLNDITEGGNQGCGTAGFSSAEGWDPVTGLGTPNFPKMKELFLSLP